MNGPILFIVLGILGCVLLLAGFAFLKMRRTFPVPKSLSENTYRVKTDVLQIAYDGKTVYGEFLSPNGLSGKKPTVICSHGFGGNYQAEEMRIGKSLAMSGWNAYCYDFCGGSTRSKSSGNFRDMTVFSEKEDLLHVIDFIKTLPEVDADRLYLLGESQGGFVSAIAAPERADDIRAMVLYYPAFCIPADAKKRFPSKDAIPDETQIMGQTLGGEYSRTVYDYDVYSVIGGYTRPVLILHGDKDTIVPVEYSQQAAEVYPNAAFAILPGEVHGWTGKGKQEAAKRSFAFLNRT